MVCVSSRTPKITTLPNGLRVASETMPSVRTAAVGVWVDGGSRSENAETNGISHMLEHMAFKGTPRRSARDIAEEVEASGTYINAYTSREETGYHLRILPESLPLAVDILADILLRPLLKEEDVKLESQVILQEIGEAQAQPEDVIYERFQETAFPEQPLGKPVAGTPERVLGFAGKDLRTHMEKHYRADRMVLAAAGDIQHENLVALARELFDELPGGSPPPHEPAIYAGGTVRVPWDIQHVHLALGFEGIPYDDPDYYALQLFAAILGGGMSSRLFQEIREKRGLAYSVHAYSSSYRDSGTFSIHAGANAKDAEEVLKIICQMLRETKEGFLPEELARVTAQALSGLLMAEESCAGCTDSLAQQLLVFERPIGIDENMHRIREVDENAICQVAERVLSSNPTFATLGPEKWLPKQEIIENLIKETQ